MELFRSTIGQKIIVAATGLVLAGFVMGHMAGNMLVFVGPEAYNRYGHALVSNKLIYLVEAVLLVSVLLHIYFTIQLTRRNRAAKTVGYDVAAKGEKRTSFVSKSMILNGPILAIFIIVHLMTFKFGKHYEVTYDGIVMRDLFRLMVDEFSNPAYVVGYIICLLLLGMHLRHGVASLFNTLGLVTEKFRPTVNLLSWIYAVVCIAGFISQPVYLLLVY